MTDFIASLLIALLVGYLLVLLVWPKCSDRIYRFMEEHGLHKVSVTERVTHNLTVIDDPPNEVPAAVIQTREIVSEVSELDQKNTETIETIMMPASTQAYNPELSTISERAASAIIERDTHIVERFNPMVPNTNIKNPWQDEINADLRTKPDEYVSMN